MVTMNDLAITSLLGFAVLIVSIFSGWLAIRNNLRDYTDNVVSRQVALEHRLTQVEVNVTWIKEHLPKRKGDYRDT